jgi:hypothetical protein
MTCTYLSQLIVSLKTQVQQSFMHLQHTRHQISLDGVGLRGLDVDSVNPSSDYFAYLCIPASEITLLQKRCRLPIDLTFDDRLQKPSEKINLGSWIARLQGVHGLLLFYKGLCFSNYVALLALDCDTPVS